MVFSVIFCEKTDTNTYDNRISQTLCICSLKREFNQNSLLYTWQQ